MGSYLNKVDEEVSKRMELEYQMQAKPYLLHRQTQQLCTLHKITANSAPDAQKIVQIIEEYGRSKCESISKLRSHYRVEDTGYCSDEQHFYLVFDGENKHTVRDDIEDHKASSKPYSDGEIESILATVLCGLREYDMRFIRKYDQLSFESLAVDRRNNRITLKDPELNVVNASTTGSRPPSLFYPSPEKLNVNRMETVNEFNSNLFTVGVMALELNKLDSVGEIYQRKREVNFDEIKKLVKQFRNQKIRRGVECLLSENPVERKNIYKIWEIKNDEEHFLIPVFPQGTRTARSPSSKKDSYNRSSKFQFPPNPSPTLQIVPSQTILVPPLQLTDQQFFAPAPPSTRSNPQQDHTKPYQTSISLVSHHEVRTAAPPSQNFTFQIPHYITNSIYHPLHSSTQANNIQPSVQSREIKLPNSEPIDSKALNFRDILAREEKKSQLRQAPAFEPFKPFNFDMRIPQIHANYQQNIPPPPLQINDPVKAKIQHVVSEIVEANELKEPQKVKQQRPLNQPLQSNKKQTVSSSQVELGKPVLLQTKTATTDATIISQKVEKVQQNIQKMPEVQKRREEKPSQEVVEQKEEAQFVRDNNQRNQQEKSHTPKRPTAKNKFNSTIVEVREEESPAHSYQSEQPHEQEYVVEEYQSGSRYEGFKSDNMRNGRGKFYYQDGGFYEGTWKNNKMDGYGKLYYEGGKLAYEGYWLEDEFNGLGKVYNDNPQPLDQPFDYTNFEYLEDYWLYYEGMLVHDTKEGRGKIKLSNKELFEGDFHNDRIQGFGKFHTRDGKTIEGIWRDSKLIKVINTKA